MHKNIVWLCFLALISGAVIWVTIKALYMMYLYTSLNAEGPVDTVTWSVEQLHEDRFVMKADYTFTVSGEKYKGETLFKNDVYWNPLAAEDALKIYEKKDWTVWYSSWDTQHSSLQKNFPLKETISAGVLWILMLYFLGLGYYVATKK